MRKKKNQRRVWTWSPPAQPLIPRNPCRILIWIDSAPQRKAASAEYIELKEKIAGVVAEIEHFEQVILPEFERWHAQSFGTFLSQQRSLHATYEEKLRLVQEVEEEQWRRGGSAAAAYRRVMQARISREAGAPAGEENTDPRQSGNRRDETQFEVLFRAMVRDLFGVNVDQLNPADRAFLEQALRRDMGIEDPAEDAEPRRSRRQERPSPPARHSSLEARCKQIYRVLVRLLHPDTGGETTAHSRQLWNDLQDAWERRDLERLELLQSLVELHQGGQDASFATTNKTSLSQLLQIVREMTGTWHDVQKRLKAITRHPASQLRDPKKAARLETKIRTELRGAIRSLEIETSELEHLIQMWSNSQPKKPKRKLQGQEDFGF